MKIIKASAGSGKTYTLSHTYLDFLLKSDDPYAYRHLLAVTFTNKATAEMKERILKDLAAASKGDGPRALRARHYLVSILHDYGAFGVSTIDRFFQQTLRSFARELGQFSAYQVELDKESLISESMDRVLDGVSEDQTELMNWLKLNAMDQIRQSGRFHLDDGLYDMGLRLRSEEYQRLAESLGIDSGRDYSKQRLSDIKKLCGGIVRDFEKEAAARGDKNEQKTWQSKASQWAEKMRLYDSGFYARSAQQVLAAMAVKSLEESETGNAASSQAPSTIALAAENLFREGQLQKAIDAYLKAAEKERLSSSSNEENVFKYQYVAAAIAHKLDDHVQAAALFRQAAIDNPNNPKAAQAFKTALFHAGKLVDVNKPETAERYSNMLDEFLKTFPDSPDVNLIRQQKQRLSEALKAIPKTPAERLSEAQTALKENRPTDAVALFTPLAKEFPNAQDVQIGFAEALSAANADQDALAQWRKVAQNVKQYSPQWYQAKYEVASLLVKTGQKDKAAEMIRLLKLLRPDLGGTEWSEKFEKLLTN